MAATILPGITPDHVVRMHDEQQQLSIKIAALSAFTQGRVFSELDEDDQHLLAAQLFAMQSYSAVLGLRIHRATRVRAN